MTAIETSAFLALHQGPMPSSSLQNGFIKSHKKVPPSLFTGSAGRSRLPAYRSAQLCQIFLVNIKCFFIPNIFGSIKYLLWYLPTQMSFCLFCPLSNSFEDQKIFVRFIIVWLHELEAWLYCITNPDNSGLDIGLMGEFFNPIPFRLHI